MNRRSTTCNIEEQSLESSFIFKKVKKNSALEGKSQGPWNLEQNLKLAVFIDFYQNVFISKEKRKYFQIFRDLSEYIQTRSSSQCRSRFQKIIKKFQTLFKFKNYYRKLIGIENYELKLEEFASKHSPIILEGKSKFHCLLKSVTEVGVQTQIQDNELNLTQQTIQKRLELENFEE